MSEFDAEQGPARASAILNRPQLAPIGPRTRLSSLRTASVLTDHSGVSLDTRSMHVTTPCLDSKPLPIPSTSNVALTGPPPDLEESGSYHSVAAAALVPPTTRAISPTPSETQGKKYLPPLKEFSEEPSPAYNNGEEGTIHPELETPPRPPVLVSTNLAKTSSVLQVPKLIPPPPISFETVSVPWKGMPLEPALWTFNSTELQDIVSRAIRSSAKESFLRLLTTENLDRVLPAELERLDHVKTTTQARYRFLVQRRSMLLHALNSSCFGQRKGEEDEMLVSKLTIQLTETILDCDQRLEELLRINDQIAQIYKLIDVHSSSALAIALRKLNSSYSRRTRDLNKARERIFQLEAELEDAWKEAEKMANELDEYEACGTDDAIIEKAEIVTVRQPSSQTPSPLMNVEPRNSVPLPMVPTLLTIKNVAVSPPPPSPAVMRFVFPPPPPVPEKDNDAISIKSSKSARSVKSTKSTRGYASTVHAAKKRSSRASQSSLRLSVASSSYHGRGGGDVPPPMPEIPPQFMNATYNPGGKVHERTENQSFSENVSTNSNLTLLGMNDGNIRRASVARPGSVSELPLCRQGLRKQTSLDALSAIGKTGSAAVDAYKGRAADDIYLRTGESHHGHTGVLVSARSPYSSDNAHVTLSWEEEASEIQAIPRTPPYRSRTFSGSMPDYRRRRSYRNSAELPPIPPPKDASRIIPSMWKHADAVNHVGSRLQSTSSYDLPSLTESDTLPQCPPQQITTAGLSNNKVGLLKHSKTLRKISGFTKRYSASIPPLFNGRQSLTRKRGC